MPHAYLIDQDNRVLLQVSGPIKTKPGQRLVLADEKIPTKLARYDEKQDKIVRAPASVFAKVKRDARSRAKARDQRMDDLEAELRHIADQIPGLARFGILLLTLPKRRILRALRSAGEE